MAFPIDYVRKSFPALQQDQVFFDNAGGSQTLGNSIEDVRRYLTDTNVQLGASYTVGTKATDRYQAAFEAGARYVNASVDEIAYGASTTQLFRNLSWTLQFEEGDEIIISSLDHESNIAPWVDLAQRQKLVIKWWEPSGNDPALTAKNLGPLLTSKTKLVTLTHASNVLGTITDVRSISDLAHSYGALVCVDGVAFAPHRPVDTKQLGVDFYCFSWYKVYGPHVSMLYASWSAQLKMKSLGHFFNPHVSLADKLGLAAASYELIQAVPSVVEYLTSNANISWDTIIGHEVKLQTLLLEYLTQRSDVTIYGAKTGDPLIRLPIVSFTVRDWNSKAFVDATEKLGNHGIRWGSFYSNRLIRGSLGLGPEGIIRVSMVHYNAGQLISSRIVQTLYILTIL